MLARNETIFKWVLYAVATALCFLVQGALLQRVTIWGVIPFLYPVLAAIPATYEGPLSGTIYALVVGVICDLLLPGSIPCFYTLVFPAAGLCAALISQSWLPAGLLCSLATSAVSFFLTGLFHCLLLWLREKPAWTAGAIVCGKEFFVTVIWVLPATLLFSWVFHRTNLEN
jgi:uncharacterized membrane protein